MELEQLGNIGEILGAIATLGTLIYIAVQIRQSSDLMKRQAFDSIATRFSSWGSKLREHSDTASLYIKGGQSFDDLSGPEKEQYNWMLFEYLVISETAIEHHKSAAFKAEAVDAIVRGIVRELEKPGAKSWWNNRGRDYFSADFATLVDEKLD